ncbi:hypothetical protein BCF11_3399 [Collimonas sp. PA-H2]|uniref:hypothetical protein n=1 Tax=Collimonas sp. PA-H2 TaxID=1881062 RepID=UPI000BF2525E|nr:hypothetical protein [Collimonas sp. PA-H2]PFH10963.1 hypothetical protein BCF11_3399 [Collimonas sp. PA-H2]
MKSTGFGALCVLAAITLSGCANLRKITAPDDENSLSGAGSILRASNSNHENSSDGFETIDLENLLTAYGLPLTISAADIATDEYKYRRNNLQERLIAASNQRCGAYIRTLLSSKSQTQSVWTTLSLLFSGAASVVPGAQAAKYFAASSTASIGILSTYNEAYFNNLAMNVISTGITKKREGIQTSIFNAQKLSLVDYPVNAAISDALSYHSACSIIAGMEVAAHATGKADVKEFLLTRIAIPPAAPTTTPDAPAPAPAAKQVK